MLESAESKTSVAIVGGGLVGLTLAIALGERGWLVTLVDQQAKRVIDDSDTRSLALSFSSVEYLKTLSGGELWRRLEPFSTPIHHLHVSEAGTSSLIRFHARDYAASAFGHTIPIRHVHQALSEEVEALGVKIRSSAQVSAVEADSGRLIFGDGTSLEAPLILACDGGNSFIRTCLDLKTERHDYHQSALVTSVTLADPHGNWAFERFLPEGVLAVLPIFSFPVGRSVGVVWVQSTEKTTEAMTWSDDRLCEVLQKIFGHRLGKFLQVGPKHAYPLEKIIAKEAFQGRVLLMGNAAHQLNPVGAQGWNLALRDIAALLKCLDRQQEPLVDKDLSCLTETIFKPYQASREPDHTEIEHLTHGMATGYGSQDFFSVIARRSIVSALRWSRRLRERFVSTLMGKRAYFSIQEMNDAV